MSTFAADNVPIFNIGSAPAVIPVVLPVSADRSLSGTVRNVPVYGKVDTSGWLVWDPEGGEPNRQGVFPGEWLVSPTKRGYMHLRDYYKAENNLDGWDAYQRYLMHWARKVTTQSFPLHLLPKKVQAMQQGHVVSDNPDPWLLPPVKPTTGRLADVSPPTEHRTSGRRPRQAVEEAQDLRAVSDEDKAGQ